jgi:hypothetical protein
MEAFSSVSDLILHSIISNNGKANLKQVRLQRPLSSVWKFLVARKVAAMPCSIRPPLRENSL